MATAHLRVREELATELRSRPATSGPVAARTVLGRAGDLATLPVGPASVLHLQATAGNRAVSSLMARNGRAPLAIQRTVWGRDPGSGQIVPIGHGPPTFVLEPEHLAALLQPGDMYDEATGIITRANGLRESAQGANPFNAAPVPGGRGGQYLKDRSDARMAGFKARTGISGREARDKRQASAEEYRKGDRLDRAMEKRDLDAPFAPARDTNPISQQPIIGFAAGDEAHTVYVEPGAGGGWRLMIASLPLPVGDFIVEMALRFTNLESKSTAKTHLFKPLPRMTQSTANFNAARTGADARLLTATGVFGNGASTVQERTAAEEALAASLHRMIVVVNALAKRLGAAVTDASKSPRPARFLADPLKAHKAADTEQYLRKMGSSMERYKIEGLVARYREQPDYPGSDFDRDHQPHNDLIETVAAQPEFAGRVARQVAAGRTQLGWSIMLHHGRHAAGRTFGNLGGQVTGEFLGALAVFRAGAPSADEVREFCVDYLVQSLKDDAARMKAVANAAGSYTDLDLPVRDAVTKAAHPNPPAADAETLRKDAEIAKIKRQILDGEDRMLATEALVKTYGDVV